MEIFKNKDGKEIVVGTISELTRQTGSITVVYQREGWPYRELQIPIMAYEGKDLIKKHTKQLLDSVLMTIDKLE